MDRARANAKAKEDCIATALNVYEKTCVSVLRSTLVPPAWTLYCAVSYKRALSILIYFLRSLRDSVDSESIIELIRMTKSTLDQSEALNIMWASAQMVSHGAFTDGLDINDTECSGTYRPQSRDVYLVRAMNQTHIKVFL